MTVCAGDQDIWYGVAGDAFHPFVWLAVELDANKVSSPLQLYVVGAGADCSPSTSLCSTHCAAMVVGLFCSLCCLHLLMLRLGSLPESAFYLRQPPYKEPVCSNSEC